jgi:acyl-CoA thioester hydrolase
MERARTEWLRNLSIEQDELIRKNDVIFAVRKVDIDYRLAARFNDSLVVSTKITKISGASIELRQIIKKVNETSVICAANIKIVSLNATKFSPCAIPEVLKSKINLTN